MAARSMKALSQRVIEELVSKSSKATSPILLPFEKSEEDAEGYNLVVVFPVMVRAGGFMVASPSSPVAQAALEAVDCGLENIEPAVYPTGNYSRSSSWRSRRHFGGSSMGSRYFVFPKFRFEESASRRSQGRAVQQGQCFGAAYKAKCRGSSSTLDRFNVGRGDSPRIPYWRRASRVRSSGGAGHSSQWWRRCFGRRGTSLATTDLRVGASSFDTADRGLGSGGKTESSCIAERAKLHQLAGSPPPRVGKQEASRAQRPKSMAFDHVLADVEKEADEMQTGEEGLDLLAQDGDALSKVMMGQLRQNQLLLQKLLGPKFQDPVLGALSSSTGSDSASAASGVKGCLARDAFIRAMNDLQRVASVTHGQCCEGTRTFRGEDRWQSHEEVRRTQNPHRRQQDGGVHCLYDGRSMDGRLGSRERATARCCEQSSVLLGTDEFGRREDAVGLATDRNGRAPIQPLRQQSSSCRAPTFLQAMPRIVGCSESQLRPRPGCVGVKDVIHGQTFKSSAATRGRRSRRSGTAEASSPTPQRQREERWRARGNSCLRTHLLSSEPSMSQGSMADLCASDHDSDAPHCSSRFNNSHNVDNQLPDLSDPSRVFNPVELSEQLISQFWSCRSALTAFALSSLAGTTCPVEKTTNRSLMPVPPIRWRWTAASRLGPRRRRRRRYHRTRAALLNLMLMSLNWETLGFPSEAPPEASVGSPISAQQHEAVERLENMLDHFLHMAPFGSDELGRASEKFQSVIECIKELPKCKLELQDLFDCLVQVKEGFDSYSKYSSLASKDHGGNPTHQCSVSGGIQSASNLASAKPVVAARVKWESPPSFEAAEFLNSLTKSAYQDPEVVTSSC